MRILLCLLALVLISMLLLIDGPTILTGIVSVFILFLAYLNFPKKRHVS